MIKKDIKKGSWKLFLLIIIQIIVLTFLMYTIYTKNCSKKIIKIAEIKIEKYIKNILSNKINCKILNENDINDILILNKNESGEILYVDYDLNKTYDILKKITDILYKEIDSNELKEIKNINNYRVLSLPLFINSKNFFTVNYGPKIYVSFKPISTILTNIKSKITDYGLNNVLVELYINLNITSNVITPFINNERVYTYDILIASKVINGRVPIMYGPEIKSKSSLFKNK